MSNQPYPKIDTLFVRDTEHRLTSEFRHPIYGQIKTWHVEEKLDGQNLRLHYSLHVTDEFSSVLHGPTLHGRTDKAQLSGSVINDIMGKVPAASHVQKVLFDCGEARAPVTLYGEGIGPKVQGNIYKQSLHSFVLFDIKLGEGLLGWLSPAAVHEVGRKLGLPTVPVINDNMNLPYIQKFVRHGFASRLRDSGFSWPLNENAGIIRAEGVVAKAPATLYDNRGRRLVLKLKQKDYS